MKIYKFALASLVISGLCLMQTQASPGKPSVQAVSYVDVEKYQGQWYEIARLPMYFQRHCAGNVTAQYSINPDKTLNVVNQCINDKGQKDQSTGVAYVQNVGNSQLKVSFMPKYLRWIPGTKGDYWILRLDQNYQVALVGGPGQKYLWLLSRTPTLDEATIASYLDTAKAQGYDLRPLIRTSQVHQ